MWLVSPLVSLIRDQEQKYMNVCNTFVIQGNYIALMDKMEWMLVMILKRQKNSINIHYSEKIAL